MSLWVRRWHPANSGSLVCLTADLSLLLNRSNLQAFCLWTPSVKQVSCDFFSQTRNLERLHSGYWKITREDISRNRLSCKKNIRRHSCVQSYILAGQIAVTALRLRVEVLKKHSEWAVFDVFHRSLHQRTRSLILIHENINTRMQRAHSLPRFPFVRSCTKKILESDFQYENFQWTSETDKDDVWQEASYQHQLPPRVRPVIRETVNCQ